MLGHRSALGLLWASRPSASTSASTSTSTSTSTGRPGRPGRSPLARRPPARRALGLALLQADLGLHHHLVREPTGYPVFISAIYDVSYDGKAATDGKGKAGACEPSVEWDGSCFVMSWHTQNERQTQDEQCRARLGFVRGGGAYMICRGKSETCLSFYWSSEEMTVGDVFGGLTFLHLSAAATFLRIPSPVTQRRCHRSTDQWPPPDLIARS